MHEIDGERDGGGEATGIGAARSGQFQRRSVIDRGTQHRKTECHVHRVTEACVLECRQTLIVIHREHCIAACEFTRYERGIRRQRTERIDAGRTSRCDGGCDHCSVFGAEVSIFPGVRVESEHGDAWRRNAEFGLQIGVQHREDAADAVDRECVGNAA